MKEPAPVAKDAVGRGGGEKEAARIPDGLLPPTCSDGQLEDFERYLPALVGALDAELLDPGARPATRIEVRKILRWNELVRNDAGRTDDPYARATIRGDEGHFQAFG